MKSIIKTYKFKLKPTKKQEDTLNQSLGICRFVYNLCLEYKITHYQMTRSNLNKNDIQKELTQLKKEYVWLKDAHSQSLQDVTDKLFKTYDNFFRGGGFPKFKSRRFYKSIGFKQGIKVHKNTNRISVPKVGKIKFFKSQDFEGNIKYCIIKKEFDGWYISLMTETAYKPIKPKNNDVIGIDLGIKSLTVDSKGNTYDNKKVLYKYENKLKKKNRELSRKKKGSNNRNKTIKELNVLYSKVKRVREDYIHKLTTSIISESQVIICEDLKSSNLLKNNKLSKSISDASWNMILNQLEYKSKWNEREFIRVSPHHTSQDCSTEGCNYRNIDLNLSVRTWTCPSCKTKHDRDVNAAINIRQKGINKLKESGHDFSTLKYKLIGDMVCVGKPAEEPLCNSQKINCGVEQGISRF